jgi:rhamnosyltransferase
MRLAAVVVTFHPSPAALDELLKALRHDCCAIVLVDNTPAPDAGCPQLEGAVVIRLGRNTGIAHAQNVGIQAARAAAAQAVILLDQDSQVLPGMAARLAAALVPGEPGVHAPVCFDVRTGDEYPSFRFDPWGRARPLFCGHSSDALVPVDMVIASGSVATVETFDRAGGMDEDFFIDYVDLEWCIRCRRAGVPIHVVPAVRMGHAIGAEVVRKGALTTFVHSPARSYYRVRNALLLLRWPHVPRLFALKEALAALVHHALQARHSVDRRAHWSAGWQGLRAGLMGVKGPRA